MAGGEGAKVEAVAAVGEGCQRIWEVVGLGVAVETEAACRVAAAAPTAQVVAMAAAAAAGVPTTS